MAGYIGKIEPFDDSTETWSSYVERLEQYFAVNALENEKKVPALLTLLGGKTYGLLRNLTLPDKPATKSYDDIVKLLKDHLSPKPLIVAERFRFYKRYQIQGETVNKYVAELRKFAEYCEFGNLNESLRDQFVVGLKDEQTQKKLLTVPDLTFVKAIGIAIAVETANKDAIELRGKFNTESSVNRIQRQQRRPPPSTTDRQKSFVCYRCNGKNHKADTCRFKDAVCHSCNKKGHIRKACRSSGKPKQRPAQKNVNSLDNQSREYTSDEDDYLGIHSVKNSNQDSIWITPNVHGKEIRMELDTGSAVSVISAVDYDKYFQNEKLESANVTLKTYSGELLIPTGYMNVQVKYNGQCENLKLYVVQKGGPALFGRDWLRKINLDWKNLKWINKISVSRNSNEKLDLLLKEYSNVFREGIGCVADIKAHLTLKENASPKFVKARPVPFSVKPQVERELIRLEKEGIISKVDTSEWASPIVPVMKSNGTIRICGDFKTTVNPMLNVDQYPLPRTDEIFATLAGGQKYTKLDLRNAYLHMEVDDESKPLMTINTHKGLYRYNRMLFGIASAPAIWQRTMDQVLNGLDSVQCMLDDMIITGPDDETHLQNLKNVLQRLQNYGLRANLQKCSFLKDKVIYCGHEISADGLRKTTDKVQAVMETPTPKNVKDVRAFLGLINYYHRFMPNSATVLKPLNQLLEKERIWRWTDDCEKAFKKAKELITSDQVLTHYNPELPVRLACDASPFGLGAVLSHVMPDGSERPISFASRSLTKSEKNYAQIQKEALGIVWGVKKFNTFLYGRKFSLITDHQPLTAIFNPEKSIPVTTAARLQRYAIFLSGFTYNIEYKNTKKHNNADALSRLPMQSDMNINSEDADDLFHVLQIEDLPITSAEIQRETRKEKVLASVLYQAMNGWEITDDSLMKPYFTRRNELTVSHGCLLWGIRVIIPIKFRNRILELLHSSHPGVVKMKALARGHVWWPGIDSDIEHLVKSCTGCQINQHAPALTPLHPWEWPETPWQRVHIDYAGPFINRMFFVMVDAHSKWPEVFEMKSITATKTIDIMRQVFARNGVPAHIVSDNGPSFASAEFAEFLRQNGIKHTKSAPYHPATNGLVERFIQTFKQSMKAMKWESGDVNKKIANFLLTYRQTPHTSTHETPSKLFLGRDLRSRLHLLKPNLRNTVRVSQEKSCEIRMNKKDRQFEVGERVIAKDYRGKDPWVAGIISEREGPLMYKVSTDNGHTWRRHTEQLKSTQMPKSYEQSIENDNIIVDNTETRTQQHVAEKSPEQTKNNEMSMPRRNPIRERNPPKRLIAEME